MKPTTLEIWFRISLAVGCFVAGLVAYRALLEIPGWINILGSIAQKKSDVPLSALMNSSVLPMYLTDEHNIIRECNAAFARFAGMERGRIIGARVGDISRATRGLVLEEDRHNFDREQAKLEKRAADGELPTGDARYRFDLQHHPDHSMRGLFDVPIHVDRIPLDRDGQTFGAYEILYPLPLEKRGG